MMKGVVKTQDGFGHVQYMEIPEPDPGPGTVKIKVKATGICGTDLHIYRDEFPSIPPVVLGHEFSGLVVAVGSGVSHTQVGDRVMSELPVEPCGRCRYCRTGNLNLCSKRRGLGWSANGSFAEYVIAEEQALHQVPARLDFEEAALCEPLAVASHSVIELTGVRSGDIVYVSGPGPVGLLVAQAARAEGALVAVGGTSADAARLHVARELGIEWIVNVQEQDVVALMRHLGGGLGADIVFECSGAPAAAAQGLALLRKGGIYTQVGLFGRHIPLDFDQVVTKELRIQGAFSSDWRSWNRALRLVEQGRVQLRPLISHRLPLREWRQAFDLVERHEGLKVLLLPEV